MFQDSEQKKCFWGRNQGKSVVVLDITVLPIAVHVQEQTCASQAEESTFLGAYMMAGIEISSDSCGPLSHTHFRISQTERRLEEGLFYAHRPGNLYICS